MRGRREPQATMLAFVDLEERVPRDHPLRVVKQFADGALVELSPVFDQMYADWWSTVHPTRAAAESLATDQSVLGPQ